MLKISYLIQLFFILLFSTGFADYPYHLSICAIFQNEAPYLKEWIEFHRLLGVEHFYLYNHRSSDDYQKVLRPYIENGLVELKHKTKKANSIKDFNSLQCRCYTECLSKAKGESKWVAFIDIDEFLFPMKGQDLKEVLKEYEEFGGVGVNWLLFGSSHVWKVPSDRLLIETLTHCSKQEFSGNHCVKSIVRPECVSQFKNPHTPLLKKGFCEVNTDKIPFNSIWSPYVKYDKLRINHYWTRDDHFFYQNKILRHKRWRGNPDQQAIKEFIQNLNKEEDKAILRFLPSLKTSFQLRE